MLEVLRSGQLSLGPRVPAFEQAFAAARRRARTRARSRPGRPGLHLALRAVGVSEGDEVVTSPFSFVASANSVLFEGARPVFADIDPVTLNLDPEAARAARDRAHDRAAAGPHLRLPGRPAGVRVVRAADRRGRVRGARRLPRRRDAGRRSRPPGGLRLLRQQAAHDRRGRDGHAGRRRDEGAHRLRAQPGPRAGHGLAGPRPARASTTASATSPARSGSPSSSGSTTCSPARARVAGWYARGARGHRGARAAGRRARRRPARLVRLRGAGPAGRAGARRRRRSRCASAASRASPTCRRST